MLQSSAIIEVNALYIYSIYIIHLMFPLHIYSHLYYTFMHLCICVYMYIHVYSTCVYFGVIEMVAISLSLGFCFK